MREKKFLDCFAAAKVRNGKTAPQTFEARLALFFCVMGPGLITAFADNDAGGIATYITAGARYGYSLLFVLLVSTVCLAVMQEMSARTGAVTGKGLFELIGERYGKFCCTFILGVLLIANIGTTVSEFSGIAVGAAIFGINAWSAVTVAAIGIWFLVIKANYGFVEKFFFLLCTSFLAYIVSGVMVQPPWPEVFSSLLTPDFSGDRDFLFMAMGIVGTTITPWGQFYIQASVVDKGITRENYRYIAVDVVLGTFFTGLIAFFVIVSTAAVLYGTDCQIENMQAAAAALEPLAGVYAKWLFAVGLLGASLLAAIILPLSTAYAVCEALHYPHGISKTYKEAPEFFLIYTGLVVLGAGLVLMPQISLYQIMMATQILNGVLLSPILIFMLLLANDRQLMGDYRNPWAYQLLAWAFTLLLIALTLLLLWANCSDI